ncbi:head GIN domain-containing protein [Undibacterium sp. TJN19]|uniref:head GIN domain-containing protein n=1 Tax=Undibacterium sp. TJN19 TaxID=3413055 RepID=UPI003BF17AFF
MKNIIRTGLGMLALSVVLTAASVVFIKAHAGNIAASGSGSEASEIRQVNAGVVNIVMHGPVDLVVKQSATPELLIKGDPKLVSRVTTRMEGNTLHIGTRGIFISFGKSEQTRAELSLPTLEKLQIAGSGDASVKGFRGNKVDLSMNGSGDLIFDGEFQQVTASLHGSGDLNLNLGSSEAIDLNINGSGDSNIKGQTKLLTAKLTGSGDLNASSLKSGQVILNSLGSSTSKVFASQEVKLKLMGSGDVHISGNPQKRNVERLGSGEVRWD